MKGEESLLVMRELLETLVDRKLTAEEDTEFEIIVTSFWSNTSDDKDRIRFVWCCSYDGIFLMAGVSDEKENKNGPAKKHPHPFVSVTGFGGFPEWLRVASIDSAIAARKMTYFCES